MNVDLVLLPKMFYQPFAPNRVIIHIATNGPCQVNVNMSCFRHLKLTSAVHEQLQTITFSALRSVRSLGQVTAGM